MDRLIYIAGSGAKQVLERQASNSNNLANASTPGFRAQIDLFKAVSVQSDGLATRSFAVDTTAGVDLTDGTIQETGKDLDVAIQGDGWLAVQTADGKEAYTRQGGLHVDENGVLQTASGASVIGDGGPITIPPDVKVAIAKDGTVSATTIGPNSTTSEIGRIKVVNIDKNNVERRDDGLFRTKDGSTPEADSTVVLVGGALEGSNVNPVDAMVNMISLSRQFDMQMKMLTNAESNATKAAQILSVT